MNVLNRKELSYGLYSQRFETQFAELHGCKYGLLMNSGTDALRIAIATLKEVHRWKDSDEMICPALTFVATANTILQNGLRIRFVDVDPHTYNIDATKLVSAISPSTRAIAVVHLFGLPADISAVAALSRKRRIKIVEDSCETMLVKHQEKPVGSWGDIGCFSTYMAHLITTGVGGLATTNNRVYADIMRSVMNHGRDQRYIGGSYGYKSIGDRHVIGKRFRFNRLGYSSRCSEMEAAIGLAQLERLPDIIKKRQQIADRLIYGLAAAGLNKYLQLPVRGPDNTQYSRMMFPLVVKQGSRNRLVAHLESRGIETREMMPLINQPIYRKLYGNMDHKFPVAAWINRKGFYVASHQKMSHHDVDHIIDSIRSFYL